MSYRIAWNMHCIKHRTHPVYIGFNAPSRCPFRRSFFIKSTCELSSPLVIQTLKPSGRQLDAQGNFVRRGTIVFATDTYLGQSVAWQRFSKLFLRFISNYVIRNAGSHRRFFLSRRRYAYTCTLLLRAPTSPDITVANILKFS